MSEILHYIDLVFNDTFMYKLSVEGINTCKTNYTLLSFGKRCSSYIASYGKHKRHFDQIWYHSFETSLTSVLLFHIIAVWK